MRAQANGIGNYRRVNSPNAKQSFDWSGMDAANAGREAVRRAEADKLARQTAEIAERYETVKSCGRIHCVRRGCPDDHAVVAVMVMSDQYGQWVQAEARTSDACPYPAAAFAELVRQRTEKALAARTLARQSAIGEAH